MPTKKTVENYLNSLKEDYLDMKADYEKQIKEIEVKIKGTQEINKILNGKIYEESSEIGVLKKVSSKSTYITKENFNFFADQIIQDLDLKDVSKIFKTPNSIGVFGTFKNYPVMVCGNSNNKVRVLYVEVGEINELGVKNDKSPGLILNVRKKNKP